MRTARVETSAQHCEQVADRFSHRASDVCARSCLAGACFRCAPRQIRCSCLRVEAAVAWLLRSRLRLVGWRDVAACTSPSPQSSFRASSSSRAGSPFSRASAALCRASSCTRARTRRPPCRTRAPSCHVLVAARSRGRGGTCRICRRNIANIKGQLLRLKSVGKASTSS